MRDFRSVLHGFFVSNIWLARHLATFRRRLADRHGLNAVQPVGRVRWHRGARYFRARDRGNRTVFLKTDGDYRLLGNEVAAWEMLRTRLSDKSGFASVRQHELDGPYPFAAFDWVDGRPLSQIARPASTAVEQLAIALRQRLAELEAAAIVHRDISPDNLIIAPGTPGAVILIDFAFAVRDGVASADDRLPESELAVLGQGYKPGPLCWDDAYACDLIVRGLVVAGQSPPGALASISAQIGRRAFERRQPPSFPVPLRA